MPEPAKGNVQRVGQICPTLGRAGDALDDLHVTACKLEAVASLVGQAPDIGIVSRDGLGLLLADLAGEITRAQRRLRAA